MSALVRVFMMVIIMRMLMLMLRYQMLVFMTIVSLMGELTKLLKWIIIHNS
jgi:hypothetical protein